MSIAARLFLLAALSVFGLLLLGGTSVYQLSSYNQKLAADLKEIGEGIDMMVDIERAQIAFKTQVQEWKNILVRGNRQEDFDKYQKQFGEEETKVQASLTKVIGALRADGEKELAATAEELAKEHLALGTKYREALKAYDTADRESGRKVDQLVKGMDRPAAKGMDVLVEKMEKNELEHLQKQAAAAQTAYESIRNILITIFFVLVIGVVGFALYIIRRIRSSLGSLRDTVEAIPHSWDLRLRVPLTGQDEITESGRAINALLASFQEVVGLIVDNASKTAKSCAHMTGSLGEIDQAVGGQNAATSSVVAAIEHLTASFEQIKSNAQDSLAANSKTTQSATAGGRVISAASDGMTQIATSVQSAAEVIERVGQQSREISTIIRVIREVADQTNLLALNAAIEAARAGEQGRGFAVVADEVRKLAEKTTGSAQEITRMIDGIQASSTQAVTDVRKVVEQMDLIGKKSHEAHLAIDEIKENTDKSEGFARDISNALSEQSSASTLIAQEVDKIANMSEENSNSVSQAKQSMLELEEASSTLQAAVARFAV